MKFSALFFALWFLTVDYVLPQDSQYWQSQYSPGGFLTPGSLVTFNADSGALYYNPALLANSKINRLSVTANAYYLQQFKIINGAGQGYDLNSTSTGSNPLMVAGNFQLNKKNNLNFAYGLISNPVIDYNATQRRDDQFNVLDDSYSPGPEYFVGQFITQNNTKEFSAVGGMAFKINQHLSAGFYLEGTSRKQIYEKNYLARAIVNPPGNARFPLSSIDFEYYVSYSAYTAKLKAGLEWDGELSHFGLLVTTPSVDLGGSGLLVADELINDIDVGLAPTPLSFLANTRQESLPVKWKNPLRVALGFSHDFGNSLLYMVAEYCSPINDYNILTPRNQAFIRPDTGNNKYFTSEILQLEDARAPVLNLGIGLSHTLSPKLDLYFSLHSDQTYFSLSRFENNTGFIPYTSTWNIYYGAMGVNWRQVKYNLRIGLYAGIGSDYHYLQDVNFDNPSEENLLIGNPGTAVAKYFETGIILSYIHNF